MLDFTDTDMDKITDKIYVGNIGAAKDTNNLKKEGIKKILSVMEKYAPNYKREDNLIQKIIEVADCPEENIIKYFGECLAFIEGNQKVLIHCMGGSSRSPSIAIAYIMWKYKLPFNASFNFVNSKRPYIFPNAGFINQLQIFEYLLKKYSYDIARIDFGNIKLKRNLIKDYNWNLNIIQ